MTTEAARERLVAGLLRCVHLELDYDRLVAAGEIDLALG
jgi:hypothetical protein